MGNTLCTYHVPHSSGDIFFKYLLIYKAATTIVTTSSSVRDATTAAGMAIAASIPPPLGVGPERNVWHTWDIRLQLYIKHGVGLGATVEACKI